MTVGELIEHLQTIDKEYPIGRVGHFGEFLPMDKYDFSVRQTYIDERESIMDMRRVNKFHALDINAPDIGEEPE